MTTSTIAERVHAFIRDQFLSGDGDGLSATTPLIENGILDSFGLFKLVAHLNELYGLEIQPDEHVDRDFRSIESIVSLVARRLEGAQRSDRSMASFVRQPDGVAVFEARSCAQVFVVFSGLWGVGMPGREFAGAAQELVKDSAVFFQRAGLEHRNVILFHDAYGQSYKRGVSPELPTPASICEWLDTWIKERPHIDEVYCLGISAGGPISMVAGHYLKAKTVWAFAPRTRTTHTNSAREELVQLVQRVTGKTIAELHETMTEGDRAQIDAHLTPAVVDEYYRSLLDPERLLDFEQLDDVVSTLSRGNGVTEHRVYYVPENACDACVAESLKACPGVTSILVTPSTAAPPVWAFSRWVHPERWIYRDHLVVDLLRERGEFGRLFPAIRLAAGAPASSEHDVLSQAGGAAHA